MPIDVAILASTIVSSFLVPVAKKAVEQVRDRLKKDVGDKAADQASSLFAKVWQRVTSLFDSDDDKATLAQFQKYPDQAAPLVEAVLKEKLAANQAAAKELSELVNQTSTVGGNATIGQIIGQTVGVMNAPGAVISGGAIAGGVVIGSPKTPAPTP
jgi:hypothetical protein